LVEFMSVGMVAVSWADLIAVAGAAAVAECDGPVIPVTLGRLDSS
jgi:L-ascorbate peroxidase